MSTRKVLIYATVLVVGFVGWYLFRPERLFTNVKVNESLPEVQTAQASVSRVLVTGQFHDGAHKTSGTASVYQLADGKQVLRLTSFETSNGPDVHVYLVAAADALDNETVTKAGFLELGSLKGNQGDQNYDLPAGTDLNQYRAVTIWCKRFSVNFGTAPLMQSMGASMPTPQMLLAAGPFHSVAHDGKGYAMVHHLADGRRILRFTEFETSNGPDLQVYLVAAADATDSETVKKAGFVTLGALKGNQGDQNYEIPADLDLAKYRAVTVWCRRFGVNFATAPLTPKS